MQSNDVSSTLWACGLLEIQPSDEAKEQLVSRQGRRGGHCGGVRLPGGEAGWPCMPAILPGTAVP